MGSRCRGSEARGVNIIVVVSGIHIDELFRDGPFHPVKISVSVRGHYRQSHRYKWNSQAADDTVVSEGKD